MASLLQTLPASSAPVLLPWSHRVPLSLCQVKAKRLNLKLMSVIIKRAGVLKDLSALWRTQRVNKVALNLSSSLSLCPLCRLCFNGFSFRPQHHTKHANIAAEHSSGHILHTHPGVPHLSYGAGQHQHFRAH